MLPRKAARLDRSVSSERRTIGAEDNADFAFWKSAGQRRKIPLAANEAQLLPVAVTVAIFALRCH
jgi:hypothetical protein